MEHPAARLFTVSRRYLPDTNIVETTFHADAGAVRLTDWPHTDARRLEDVSGHVAMALRCDPRPVFGAHDPIKWTPGVRVRERRRPPRGGAHPDGEQLGDVPQGFAHIALINCAFALARPDQRCASTIALSTRE